MPQEAAEPLVVPFSGGVTDADNDAFDIDIFVPGASLVAYVGHQCVK